MLTEGMNSGESNKCLPSGLVCDRSRNIRSLSHITVVLDKRFQSDVEMVLSLEWSLPESRNLLSSVLAPHLQEPRPALRRHLIHVCCVSNTCSSSQTGWMLLEGRGQHPQVLRHPH